jgi:serine/threonine protein kinase
MNQLERVLEVTGRPSQEELASVRSPFAATMLDTVRGSVVRPLKDWFPGAHPDAVDLIVKCMAFNPDKRISAADALKHRYVACFHNAADEATALRALRIQVDDNVKYSAACVPPPPPPSSYCATPFSLKSHLPCRNRTRPVSRARTLPSTCSPAALARQSIPCSDYRDRLYREIAKRKSAAKEALAKEEEMAASGGGGGGGGAPPAAARSAVISTPARPASGGATAAKLSASK